MNSISMLFCMVAVIYQFHRTQTAVAIMPLQENLDYPGKCYMGRPLFETPVILNVGEEYYPEGECQVMVCRFDRQNKPKIDIIGCGLAIAGNENCRVVEDLTQQHPNCCPTIKCNDTH